MAARDCYIQKRKFLAKGWRGFLYNLIFYPCSFTGILILEKTSFAVFFPVFLFCAVCFSRRLLSLRCLSHASAANSWNVALKKELVWRHSSACGLVKECINAFAPSKELPVCDVTIASNFWQLCCAVYHLSLSFCTSKWRAEAERTNTYS